MGRRSGFTREEKVAAVKQATEGGRTLPSVASEYGIHENTLWKWKRQYAMDPEGAFAEDSSIPEEGMCTCDKAGEQELAQLKQRIRELEEENEFLKKVSAYFARSPL